MTYMLILNIEIDIFNLAFIQKFCIFSDCFSPIISNLLIVSFKRRNKCAFYKFNTDPFSWSYR